MAWSKAKKFIVVGGAVAVTLLLVIGGVKFFKWFRDPQRIALARGERAIAKHLAEPVDLTANSQGSVWNFVPTGFQTFNNVPLQIDGTICLWGEGGASKGMNDLPKEVTGIPVGRKFETLYVYEGSFYGSPYGTPVYDIVFRYENGSSATNTILYGEDVLDWYANGGRRIIGPSAARSKLAWHGEHDFGTRKQNLRFCMTAVENPQPASVVASIDLYSSKNRTVAVILALTTGRAKMMQ
jgi:hypothetical protein